MAGAARARRRGAPSGVPDGAAPGAGPDDAATRGGETGPVTDAAAEQTGTVDTGAQQEDVPTAPDSRRLEVVCAVVAVAATGLLVLLSGQIEVRTETGGIDPRWWPGLLGMVGLGLAALLLLVAVLRPPFSRAELEAATRQGWVRTVLAVALTVAFVMVWPVVGFLVATPVFLLAVTYVFGGRGWRTLILFPALTTAFIYLLFHSLLKVPL